MLTSIMWIGGILAVPIVPHIADTWGRRIGIVIGCSIMLVGVALVSIGFHIALFAIGRLVLGFGLGIAQVRAPTRPICYHDNGLTSINSPARLSYCRRSSIPSTDPSTARSTTPSGMWGRLLVHASLSVRLFWIQVEIGLYVWR